MTNDEIAAGIKNALNRGFNLEEATSSFINAGYNQQEVNEASSYISRGISPLPSPMKEESIKDIPKKQEEASGRLKWILITLTGLVILAIALSMLLFKNQFLALVDKFFP
ncbi:hypothetical protein J4229_03330 [Candidatus Pacearchaeota archaeon]|nr:hypothetical protein [Candidatus Pacearchaeota archaeon]